MSNLLAYLEKYFPAPKWRSLLEKEGEEGGAPSSSNFGAGSNHRRKNQVNTEETSFKASIEEGSEWNEDDVRRTFMENYGVSVRIESDAIPGSTERATSSHFLFKYYVILQGKETWAQDTTGVLGDCRGTIVRCDRKSWKLAARPFEKFFNQQEIACPVHTAPSFNNIVQDMEFVEKADGTMMVLWFRQFSDSYGHWQWSTSTGLVADDQWVTSVSPYLYIPSAASHIEGKLKKTEKFNLVDESLLDKDLTYVFELCTKDTQVITRYETERIYLLGALSKTNFDFFAQTKIDEIALQLNVMRPSRVTAKSQGITSLQEALKWVEEQADPAKNDGKFGAWPEGFVVYYREQPLCKMKNRAYNDRHVFYASDLVHMRRLIVERFFAGTTDDVLGFCPPPIVSYIDELTQKVQNLVNIVVLDWKRLSGAIASGLKSIPAEEAPTYVVNLLFGDESIKDRGLSKFFVKKKALLLDQEENQEDEASIREMFMSWLTVNWKSLSEYWKDTDVREIVVEEMTREWEKTLKRNWIDRPPLPSNSIVARITVPGENADLAQFKLMTELLKAGWRTTTPNETGEPKTEFWRTANFAPSVAQVQLTLNLLAVSYKNKGIKAETLVEILQ